MDSSRLVRDHVRVGDGLLEIGDETLVLEDYERIVVVGGGKAGAGMAEGLELALGEPLLKQKRVSGWINVPADCVRPLRCIHLHAARPAGLNEPTPAGIEGAERILQLVQSLTSRDLCLCLISGGGSALLPAPIEGVTLADKQALTKFLSAAGANIQELNTVRKQLSRIKGGGLSRACGAGRLVTLIISDVLGDPLDVIASGPTVENSTSAQDALAVLDKFGARRAGLPPNIFAVLERAQHQTSSPGRHVRSQVTNLVIGNNATAVDAAGEEAERRGYSHALLAATRLEGAAEEVGRHHARMALRMRDEQGPDCLISGGEPTVQLVEASRRGKGGRNQQLVLAALSELMRLASTEEIERAGKLTNPVEGMVMLSGGTDGEDGPTDAAGAVLDAAIFERSQSQRLDPNEFLARNDAYHFFEPLGGLIKTGPTHTNVCDLRVLVVSQSQ